jgi:hypothetical protein
MSARLLLHNSRIGHQATGMCYHIRMMWMAAFLCYASICPSIAQQDGRCIPFQKNGLWGFWDAKGQVLHDAQFQYLITFKNGYRLALLPTPYEDTIKKVGLIDDKGKIVLPIEYSGYKFYNEFVFTASADKLFFLRKGNKWGMFSYRGKELLPCQYDGFSSYEDNVRGKEGLKTMLFRYSLLDSRITRNSRIVYHLGAKRGFVDPLGKIITGPEFDDLVITSADQAMAKKGKYGLITTEGKPITPFELDTLYMDNVYIRSGAPHHHPGFEKGVYYMGSKSVKYGILDRNGQNITDYIWDMPPELFYLTRFEGVIDGKPSVWLNGKLYPNAGLVLTESGTCVLETASKRQLWNMNEQAKLPNLNSERDFYISDSVILNQNEQELYGVFDAVGRVIQPFQWDMVKFLYRIQASPLGQPKIYFTTQKDDLYGLMDEQGSIILDCKFIHINKDFAITKSQDDLYGVVGLDGKQILPPKYKKIDYLSDYIPDSPYDCKVNCALWADDESGTTVFDKNGTMIRAFPNKIVRPFKALSDRGKPIKKSLNSPEVQFYKFQVIANKNNAWGLMDEFNAILLAPIYAEIDKFKQFFLEPDKHLVHVSENDKKGIYDLIARKWVIPCQYDEISKEHLAYFYVQKGYQNGVIDTAGKVIVPVEYADVHVIRYIPKPETNQTTRSDLFAIKRHDKWAIITPEGNAVTPALWAEVDNVYNDLIRVAIGKSWEGNVCKEQEWYYIELNGKIWMSEEQLANLAKSEFDSVKVPKYTYFLEDPFYYRKYPFQLPSKELITYSRPAYQLLQATGKTGTIQTKSYLLPWNPSVALIESKIPEPNNLFKPQQGNVEDSKQKYSYRAQFLMANGSPLFPYEFTADYRIYDELERIHDYRELAPLQFTIDGQDQARYLDTRSLQWRDASQFKRAERFNQKGCAIVQTKTGYGLIDTAMRPLTAMEFQLLKGIYETPRYFPAKQHGKWGVIQSDGKIIVPLVYHNIELYQANKQDTVWKVWKNREQHGLWSFGQKREIVAPRYQEIYPDSNFQRFWVLDKHQWRLVDSQARTLKALPFTRLVREAYSNLLTPDDFKGLPNVAYHRGQWHFIDLLTGQVIHKIAAQRVFRVDDSLYAALPLGAIQTDQSPFLLYDRRGQLVLPQPITGLDKLRDFDRLAHERELRTNDNSATDSTSITDRLLTILHVIGKDMLPAGTFWVNDPAYKRYLMVGNSVLDTFQFDSLHELIQDHNVESIYPNGVVFERQGKFGYIDYRGQVVIAPTLTAMEYDPIQTCFNAMRGNQSLQIDTTGFVIGSGISPLVKAKLVQDTLPNGLRIVYDHQQAVYGVVAPDGQVRIPFEYSKIVSRDDQYLELIQNDLFGLADTMANIVMKAQWHEIVQVDWAKNRVIVGFSGNYGIVTRDGKPVSLRIYDYLSAWNNGCSQAKLGNNIGFIDQDGKVLTPIEYTEAEDYACSCCPESLFTRMKKGNQTALAINGRIEMAAQPYEIQEAFGNGLVALFDAEKAKYGFYNWRLKKQVSNFIYDEVRVEEKGNSSIASDWMTPSSNPDLPYEEDTPIDQSTSPELPLFRVSDIGAVVRQGDKYGLLLSDGKGIPCQYDDVDVLNPNLAAVRQGKYWYVADFTGRLINPSLAIDSFEK